MIERTFLALILVLLLWLIWNRTGRALHPPSIDLNLTSTVSLGDDSGAGNLVGIQPYMTPWDYATRQRFYLKLAGYLENARECGWLNAKTIVVFPEYIGTWLVAAGEKRSVYRASNVSGAMATLIASHPISFLSLLLTARVRPQPRDRVRYRLFRLKAETTADIYQSVFSRLASEYGVNIVAGSVVLPSPELIDGKLTAGKGALQNISIVIDPDGEIHDQVVRKAYPTEEELSFIEAASMAELPVFETPAGRLGVLICADSWYPSVYEAIKKKRPELILVPSYLSPDGVWTKPWRGYNGAAQPKDVDPKDIDRLTEEEAWRKYALPGRLQSSGALYGMNVFLRGRIWDLGSDGRTLTVIGEELVETEHTTGASITNCWIACHNSKRSLE